MDYSSLPIVGGRYRIDDLLGEGGMGTVYRGLDTRTGESVAIKLLKPDAVSLDSGLVERFNREAEALRQLNHPNIVKVFSTLQDDNKHYIIMEYVGGGSLHDLLGRGAQPPLDRILTISLELTDALTRAHHLKIIHRDLKPANVLIADDDSIRLTDFGVAQFATKERVTQSGVIIGTPDYLCPEVLQGDAVDQRADIWAFGVILFELLTGQLPFTGDTISQVITSILTKPLPDLESFRPDTPIALVDLLYRMLEKDPNKRIPSIRLVGAELEMILTGVTTLSLAIKAPLPNKTFVTSTPIVTKLRNNLPLQTTPFVERGNELSELSNLITGMQGQIITIVAPGGMGKTRVSLELGSRFAAERADAATFPNGILFVQLAPLLSAENIPAAIADAAELILVSQGAEPKQQLFNYFREKKLLLIMDNFEHVLDGATLVSEIVQAAPGVKVLVTSRTRLNLQGESVFRLEGMSFPKQKMSQDALDYDAVKLFMQSVRQLQPTFEPTDDALHEMIRICRLVDGLPLGIVLAASWIETISLHEIADEIANNLDFLESESRDMPERQRSIRAVFDYSWRLLTNSEQLSMMKLSLFRGGFSRHAAQAVAGANLKTLAALVNKSLLRRDPASGRYEVHELIRQYAEEKLDQSGLLEQGRSAHLDYFAIFGEPAFGHLTGSGQIEWARRIDADLDNIRVALTWAYHGGNPEQGLRIASGIWPFWFRQGYLHEGLDWLQAGLAQTEGVTPLRANALTGAATLAGNMGFSRAAEFGMKSVEYAQQLGLKPIIALQQYVIRTFSTPDYTAACQMFDTGIQMLREDTSVYYLLIALGMYADRTRLHGDFGKSESLYNEQLDTARSVSNDHVTASATANLGRLAIHQRDYERAAHLLGEALLAQRKTGFRLDIAETLIHLGTVQMYQGYYAQAEQSLGDSLSLWRDIGQLGGIAHALHCLANVKLHQDNDLQATQSMKECLQVASQTSGTFLFAEFSIVRLLIVGRLACRHQAYEMAAQLLAASALLTQQVHFPLEPMSQDEYEAAVAEVRSQLGEERSSALWAEGQKMDEPTALQLARDYLDRLLQSRGLNSA